MARPIITQDWKEYATRREAGYYNLQTYDTGDVPVRLFLTPELLAETPDAVYAQIINATRFPGVKCVVITPDVHVGFGVPVGSVILTDGTLAMGPVGYDIGCGIVSARSNVPAAAATPEKRLEFNRAVMATVDLGLKSAGNAPAGKTALREFEELVRGGARRYLACANVRIERNRAERDVIPVDDDWQIPWGGEGRPERGIMQLGSLGAGNHFMELQRCEETGTLFVMAHTGSRGFGHGLATHYFRLAKQENRAIESFDLGYFTPDSRHYRDYLNAVAAGANYAIINRLILYERIARAFRKVFKADLELIYEISHNLVQQEQNPDYGDVWVHRKGATRAFPAGHPSLAGSSWQATGHPVLIPGSNKDYSYILYPQPGAVHSAYSINHGAGRRLSRGNAQFDQTVVNAEYAQAGVIVNDAADVPLDESAACYKPMKMVLDAVLSADLARVGYTLWPLASLKGND